ncbi:MAG: hypothetical protein AVDCRST_MAG54-3495, partial [uncultured Actinomycetospora sp.]
DHTAVHARPVRRRPRVPPQPRRPLDRRGLRRHRRPHRARPEPRACPRGTPGRVRAPGGSDRLPGRVGTRARGGRRRCRRPGDPARGAAEHGL